MILALLDVVQGSVEMHFGFEHVLGAKPLATVADRDLHACERPLLPFGIQAHGHGRARRECGAEQVVRVWSGSEAAGRDGLVDQEHGPAGFRLQLQSARAGFVDDGRLVSARRTWCSPACCCRDDTFDTLFRAEPFTSKCLAGKPDLETLFWDFGLRRPRADRYPLVISNSSPRRAEHADERFRTSGFCGFRDGDRTMHRRLERPEVCSRCSFRRRRKP